jgi:transposase
MIWIGVDAHKRVHQAVALGPAGVVAQKQVRNTPTGWAELHAWATTWPERVWAIEGTGSYGRGLAQFLVERTERVHEVSPAWTAHRRRTMRKPGKSDRLDAQAVARLLRDEGHTRPVIVAEEPDVASIQLWSRLRDDLVADMTRVRNRLHALLLLCDPEYEPSLPRLTTRAGIAAAQQYVAPEPTALAREREQAVRRTADHLALLADQERELRRKLERTVEGRLSPRTTIAGVGPIGVGSFSDEIKQPPLV